MEEGKKQLQEIVDECNNLVFFGGAGVSTESGIPDFRSVDGLYHMKYDYPPETILSHTFFKEASGGILPVLPGQNAHSGCEAQCGTLQAG